MLLLIALGCAVYLACATMPSGFFNDYIATFVNAGDVFLLCASFTYFCLTYPPQQALWRATWVAIAR
jgi:hypothetical protein